MVETALMAQVVIFALVTAIYLISRSASMFHPLTFYLVFHFLVFVWRPWMVHYAGFDSVWLFIGFWPNDEQFAFALAVSSVGLIAFALACGLAGQAPPDLVTRPPLEFSGIEKMAFALTAALLGPMAVYSAALKADGVDFTGAAAAIEMERDPLTNTPIYVNNTGYLTEAHGMGLMLTLGFILIGRFRWWSFLPLAAFIGYRAWLGWGRWAFVMALLALMLLWLYHRGHIWPRPWQVLAALPVLWLFHQIGRNRQFIQGMFEKGVVERDAAGRWYDGLDTQDLANFDFLSFITWVVPDKTYTYTYFTQYLQLLTEPIPRMFWAEKPVGPPIQYFSLHDYGNFTNLTTALIGDGWMSGGWIGLIVTMAVVGGLLGRLHRWFWRRHGDGKYVALLYCTFLPLSLQWFRDGGISIFKFSLFALFPLAFWLGVRWLLTVWTDWGARTRTLAPE
ncbi:MAG TPA: hypothetical protein VEB64_09580 [Azospirillaceae bacterium]|nr:hypothetical protein [Azospirillaceae bacterium]